MAGPTGAQKQQQQQSGAGAEKGRSAHRTDAYVDPDDIRIDDDDVRDDEKDLGWATVLKRTFEQYLREEAPNMVSPFSVTTLGLSIDDCIISRSTASGCGTRRREARESSDDGTE